MGQTCSDIFIDKILKVLIKEKLFITKLKTAEPFNTSVVSTNWFYHLRLIKLKILI